MLPSTKVCVFLACLFCSLESAYAQRATDGRALPSQQTLERYGLKLAWWGQANLDPIEDRVRWVTIDEEVVVVQSMKGVVTTFDHNNGRRLWSAQYGRPDVHSYSVTTNDELIIIPVGLRLYAVDKFNGELVWQVILPTYPSTSPSVDSTRVYIGSLNGSLYAYNLKTVRKHYEEGADERWSFLALDWTYLAGKRISTPPVSNDRNVAFGSVDGLLYSVETLNHRLRFQFEPDAPISAPLGYSENLLFAVTEGFKVYCMNSDNGNILWEYAAGTPIHRAPRIVGPQLFLVTDRGSMYCVSKTTRELFWVKENVSQFLAATNSFVYVADQIGNVHLVSRKDGTEIGMLPLRHYPVRPENDRTDRLFMVNETGRILCIHEKGSDYPLYHQFPDRRPILPEITPEAPAGPDPAATPEPTADASGAAQPAVEVAN
jgi:outer membrane protein assembly factor BamB